MGKVSFNLKDLVSIQVNGAESDFMVVSSGYVVPKENGGDGIVELRICSIPAPAGVPERITLRLKAPVEDEKYGKI